MSKFDIINKADGRINKKQLKYCLQFMESKLSKEGYSILYNFLSNSTNGGWNRWQKLINISSFFGNWKYSKTKPHYLIKSDLISYSNKDLLGLINGIDLISIKGKIFLVEVE